MGQRSHDICRGASGLPAAKEAVYRANWLLMLPGSPGKIKREPVGDRLAQIFAWVGQAKRIGCGCGELQAQMNCWGARGCRQHMGQILERLRTEAWNRGIPMTNVILRPIVKHAIRQAERKTTVT